MLRRFLYALSIAGILAAGAFVFTPLAVQAQETEKAAPAAKEKPSAFSTAQRAELQAIIKQFVLDNPQSLITSVETYYNKQNDTKTAQEGRVDQIPAGLYDSPYSPYAGKKDAKFVIVEFFDYNCGYCKQVANDFDRLIKEEPEVKYVFKELPILSEMSEVAARFALAANMQGKYMPFHMGLMQHQGSLDMGVIEVTAKSAGLDFDKMKKDADTQDVRDALNKNIELARSLGIRGTPFFLIGKEKVPGAVGYTQMKEMILKERDGVVVPTAPSSDDDAPAVSPRAAAPSGATSTSSSTGSNVSPEIKAAIDDAKNETNALLKDIQEQAKLLEKATTDLSKQAAAAEKEKAAAAEKKPAAKTE